MSVMVRGNFPRLLRPGLNTIWGLEYEDHPYFYSQMFEVLPTEMNYEEDVELAGFGLVPVKNEGSGLVFDRMTQLNPYKYKYQIYALGFIVSMEELMDNLYIRAEQRTRALARSARVTKDIVATNVFNRGFDSAVVYGDGVEAFSLAHPTLNGNQQNELTVAANLSEKALEDLCILVNKAQDTRGLEMALQTKALMVPPALRFEATRILDSDLQNNTANNATNALKTNSRFPDGIIVNPYLTNDKAFFVKTDAPNSYKFFERTIAQFGEYQDNADTFNTKFYYMEGYVPGLSDWRGYYASPGV